MFVRIKTTPNSPHQAVQIVQSVRRGNKISQNIIRHIGFARNDEELEKLKLLAESIKIKIEAGAQRLLISPEELAVLKLKAKKEKKNSDYKVDLRGLIEEERVVSGIHEVYGRLFDELGYKDIFPDASGEKALVDMFKNIVFARIANPMSKRSSVDMLAEDFGISLNLDKVYRMMDRLDDDVIERLNKFSYHNSVGLLGGKIDVVFFDTTTIYFESFIDDELRRQGYSKDLKFNQPQVLLALLVTREGLPIGYKLFPGNTYEGKTLVKILEDIKKSYKIGKVIIVADSAMLSESNLTELQERGFKYIVGARIKNADKAIKEKILNLDNYRQITEGYKIAVFKVSDSKKLIVSYREERAKKDSYDRIKAIEKLQKKLQKSNNQKEYISMSGYRKYLKVRGNSSFEINEKKVEEDQHWDGLKGVFSNCDELSEEEILEQYHNLWNVEEAFRVTKHDLKVRPVFHWVPSRVRAHFAICFTAFVLVKHLAYRVKLQYKNLSIEKIRQDIMRVQRSILYDTKRKIRYGLPSKISQDARKIYQIMGISHVLTPYIIEKCSA